MSISHDLNAYEEVRVTVMSQEGPGKKFGVGHPETRPRDG